MEEKLCRFLGIAESVHSITDIWDICQNGIFISGEGGDGKVHLGDSLAKLWVNVRT